MSSNSFRPQDLYQMLQAVDSYGKVAPEREDKHAQRGGCGDPGCNLCYNQTTGELNDERGKYGTMGQNEPVSATIGRWGDFNSNSRPEPEDLQALRQEVQKYLIAPDSKITWESVIGNPRAKEELRDAIEASITHKKLYDFYGVKAPKGVCLFGPPGCGKTMFAKAAANALSRLYGAKCELLLINASEIESPIISVAGRKVQLIFEFARQYAAHYKRPLLIFIDEADALLCSRERAPWSQEVVSAFLTGMDGLKVNGAFIILATNRPDALDQALLRDGRIDLKIKVTRPDREAAIAILEGAVAGQKGFRTQPNFSALAEEFFSYDRVIEEFTNPGTGHKHLFTLGHIINGAMLVGLVDRAKRVAFRRDRLAGTITGVEHADFMAALEEIFVEAKGINHDYAVKEFILDVALPAEAEIERRKMN